MSTKRLNDKIAALEKSILELDAEIKNYKIEIKESTNEFSRKSLWDLIHFNVETMKWNETEIEKLEKIIQQMNHANIQSTSDETSPKKRRLNKSDDGNLCKNVISKNHLSRNVNKSEVKSCETKNLNYVSTANISQSNNTDCIYIYQYYQIGFNQITDHSKLFINFDVDLLAELILNNYEPFQWPKKDNILKTENEATPDMIEHLSTYINIEPYQIRNVKNQNSFTFSIALENSIYNGRPDAVIVPKNSFSSIFQTRVVFEFKTSESMNKSSQRKLELMASSIAAFHPVLVVQTDLKTFYLLVCYDKKIFQYYSKDAKQAIGLINYWLKHLCNPSHEFSYLENENQSLSFYIDSMIDLKLLNSKALLCHKRIKYIVRNWYGENETNEISNNSEQDKEKAKKVCLAFFNQHKRTRIFGRSGICYKIQIDNQPYALKLHDLNDSKRDPLILQEMRQEKRVYENLATKPEGNWPKLFYGGFLVDNNYFAICTNYIDGHCYTKEEMQAEPDDKLIALKKYCVEAIDALRSNGICHGDVRAPNFIFRENKAFIIDFGFSRISTHIEDYQYDLKLLNDLFEKTNAIEANRET